MKNKPNHVMVDLETMGTVPGCAVVSIGAVVFDPRHGVVTGDTFYRELDYMAQEAEGLLLDAETMAWWEDQSPDAKDALMGLDSLREQLRAFARWLPKDCKVWGNGATFDVSILEYCYRFYKQPIPWRFWNVRDCRTVKDMFECSRGGFSRKMGGVKHNALDDALFQAEYINKMWNALVGGAK